MPLTIVDVEIGGTFIYSSPREAIFATPGTYSWTAPMGVTSISLVAVGGGGGGSGGRLLQNGGGGGSLGYKNNIAVTPGATYTVVVGAGGQGGQSATISPLAPGTDGGNTSFNGVIYAYGGKGGPASNEVRTTSNPGSTLGGILSPSADGGGAGGPSLWGTNQSNNFSSSGGGGTGGYAGAGGRGSNRANNLGGTATAGTGGGGGGGMQNSTQRGQNGGGVGLLGQGANGIAGVDDGATGGGGGSGGETGLIAPLAGASYGGGGGGGYNSFGANGGGGALRIIWPGTTRQFPSTNVETL